MPVILDPADYDAWLNPGSCTWPAYSAPYEGEEDMTTRQVSTYVNNARNQGPECVASA